MELPKLKFWLDDDNTQLKKFTYMIFAINFIIALIILYFSESAAVIALGDFARSFVRSDLTTFGSPAANTYHLVSWIIFILYFPRIWGFVRDFSDGGDFLQRFFLLLMWMCAIYQIYLSRDNHYNHREMIYLLFKLETDSILFPIGSVITTIMQIILAACISSLMQKILTAIKKYFIV